MSEHAVPSPVYPLLHAHENVPALFVHAALQHDSCARECPVEHSSMSEHAVPLSHENVPALFVHAACMTVVHSN